jgi:hypothetical protein
MKQPTKHQAPLAHEQYLEQPLSTQDEAQALQDTIEQNEQFEPGLPAETQGVDGPDLA